ncbi:hypothetical protein K474DRAFT_1665982, partial [Panus rudis PR-1116 ss-1]
VYNSTNAMDGILTLSQAGLVPLPSRSRLPRWRRRSSHSPQVNPSPEVVLDPRPNGRNPTYIPMIELGDTPKDVSSQVAAAADGDTSEMRPGAWREGSGSVREECRGRRGLGGR